MPRSIWMLIVPGTWLPSRTKAIIIKSWVGFKIKCSCSSLSQLILELCLQFKHRLACIWWTWIFYLSLAASTRVMTRWAMAWTTANWKWIPRSTLTACRQIEIWHFSTKINRKQPWLASAWTEASLPPPLLESSKAKSAYLLLILITKTAS